MAEINATVGQPFTTSLEDAPEGIANWQVRIYDSTDVVVLGPPVDDHDTLTAGVTSTQINPDDVLYQVDLTAPTPADGYEPDDDGRWIYSVAWMSGGVESEPDVLFVTARVGWSYSGDPSTNERDAVRFEVPDTDPANQLVQDAEIEWALAQEGSILGAAARCCEALARRFAARPDTSFTSGGDTVKRTYSAMAKEFAARAAEIRTRTLGSSAPWFGGSSHARKDALGGDPDRVQAAFRRDQFGGPAGTTL